MAPAPRTREQSQRSSMRDWHGAADRFTMAIGGLRRMPEIDHVAVLNDVVLPLEAQLGVIAARGEGAARQQVLVANALRPDEPARDIAVDFPRREHGGRVA